MSDVAYLRDEAQRWWPRAARAPTLPRRRTMCWPAMNHRDSPARFYDRVAERNSGHGCANGDSSSGDVTAAAHLAVP